jgi:NAD(P)H-quinone oxidoreductase subunit 5
MHAVLAAVPLAFGLAALFPSAGAPFRRATWAAALALGLAILAAPAAARAPAPGLVRLDAVTAVMLLLVSAIGLVIVRYSRTYLRGERGQDRYARWLCATLAAVTTLVIANDLLLVAAAWTGTSLALHQLLTFFADRPAAQVAAHKKFLVSRLADVCLWTGIALVRWAVGSTRLDAIASFARAHEALPPALGAAATLFVVAACLKSAQLPFHGWLTQVMEAPTPVSALLHAGVVNIGGFLMIRLAPLMVRAPGAQLLLVALGMTTAVLAALVMTTRVSVKVALAWSTCAQMGFMLVQCGLGAYPLALLHLVAHSLYKAHAFLSAGSAVEAWRAQSLARRAEPASLARLAWTALAVLASAALAVAALSRATGISRDPSVAALAILVALSLVPLFARGPLVAAALRGLGVTILYFGWHAAAERLSPAHEPAAPAALGWAIVVTGFVILFTLQSLLEARPAGALARWLHPRLFAGLHLDELFTRATFRVWPPRLPARAAAEAVHEAESQEA